MPPPELIVETMALYLEFYSEDTYEDYRGFQIRYRILMDDSDKGGRSF